MKYVVKCHEVIIVPPFLPLTFNDYLHHHIYNYPTFYRLAIGSDDEAVKTFPSLSRGQMMR